MRGAAARRSEERSRGSGERSIVAIGYQGEGIQRVYGESGKGELSCPIGQRWGERRGVLCAAEQSRGGEILFTVGALGGGSTPRRVACTCPPPELLLGNHARSHSG